MYATQYQDIQGAGVEEILEKGRATSSQRTDSVIHLAASHILFWFFIYSSSGRIRKMKWFTTLRPIVRRDSLGFSRGVEEGLGWKMGDKVCSKQWIHIRTRDEKRESEKVSQMMSTGSWLKWEIAKVFELVMLHNTRNRIATSKCRDSSSAAGSSFSSVGPPIQQHDSPPLDQS